MRCGDQRVRRQSNIRSALWVDLDPPGELVQSQCAKETERRTEVGNVLLEKLLLNIVKSQFYLPSSIYIEYFVVCYLHKEGLKIYIKDFGL